MMYIVPLVILAIGIAATHAAYRNGVTDGYGYAFEPSCPGYWKAGRYLRKYLRHRWPEVMKGALDDPEYVSNTEAK